MVLGGIYLFYLLEIGLHGLGDFIKKVLTFYVSKCVYRHANAYMECVLFPTDIFSNELIDNKEYPIIAKIRN